MGFSIDDILQTHGMGTGGSQNTGRLIPKNARLTITQPSSSIIIPTSLSYRLSHDLLVVYANQKYIALNADYTLSADAKSILKKTGTYDANTVFDFYLITNIKNDIPTFDGALLADGSVVESKLALEVRNKLDATLQIGTLHQEFNILEAKTRVMREVTANTQLITEAGNLVASGTTFGGNGAYEFGLKPDRAETTTTVALAIGTTALNGKVTSSPFAVDDWVTIYDDVNMEDVRVTAVSTGVLTITATTKAFKSGAAIKRTTMIPLATGKGYTFPKWGTTQLNKGTIRFKIPSTDEAVVWATRTNDLTTTMKSFFTPGGVVNDVPGVSQSGTEIIETSPIGGGTTVDLKKTYNFHFGFRHASGAAVSISSFAVDSRKNVYVVGSQGVGSRIVQKFDVKGNLVWSNVEYTNAILVAVGPDDSLYVGYNENSMNGTLLRKFSPSGVELWRKTRSNYSTGPYSGVLMGAMKNIGVAANGDVVVNLGNPGSGLIRYNPQGNVVWMSFPPSADYLSMDPFGNMFTAVGSTLYKINADGTTAWTINAGGTGEGTINAMAADVFGNIIVGFYNYESGATSSSPRRFMKKFNSVGSLVWGIDGPSMNNKKRDSVYAMTTDVQGNILVRCDGHIYWGIEFAKYDPAGNLLIANESYMLNNAIGTEMAVVPDGTTYFIEAFNGSHVIHQLDPGFTELTERPTGSSPNMTNFQKTISFDKDGNSYWSDNKPKQKNDFFDTSPDGNFYTLYKSDPDGAIIWSKDYPTPVSDTAVDSEGNVLVALFSQNDSIIKLDPDGKKLWGKELYDYGFKCAVGPNDTVYVVYRYGEVQRFDKNGTLLNTNLEIRFQGYYDEANEFKYFVPTYFLVDGNGRCFLYRHRRIDIDLFSSTLVSTGVLPSFPNRLGGVYQSNPTNATVDNSTEIRAIAIDKLNNVYTSYKGTIAKYNAAFVKQWQVELPYNRLVSSSGYLYGEIDDIGVDEFENVYALNPHLSVNSSFGEVRNGIRKLNRDGKMVGFYYTGQEGIQFAALDINPKNEIVLAQHSYLSGSKRVYGNQLKLGKTEKLKSWTIVEDNKTWYLRSTKNTAVTLVITIKSGDTSTTETVTIPANVTYRYVLAPEKFGIGMSTIRFAFDFDGYEEWAVSRTSETLAITQFLVVNNLLVQMQLQLDVSRPNGSVSYLHKYLGGIG